MTEELDFTAVKTPETSPALEGEVQHPQQLEKVCSYKDAIDFLDWYKPPFAQIQQGNLADGTTVVKVTYVRKQ